MSISLAGVAVLGALSLAPPAALASAPGCYGDCKPGVVRSQGVLKYDTLPGFNDQVTVFASDLALMVTNPGSTMTAGPGCTLVNTHQARCDVAFSISVRTLDGDDTLVGGFGSDLLQGGPGSDTASYSEVSNRLGIRADLDGVTGDDGSSEDGPAGARDTIAPDVENLEGTNADDVLIGNTGPNVIDGSGGHDQVQGLGGDDALTADGGGSLDGGVGTDQCTSDLRLVPNAPDKFIGCEHTSVLTPFDSLAG
jgi:Ca2+-binding RTX toxin-like protein